MKGKKEKKERKTAISLFSSAGIGEYYLADIGVDVIKANELIKSRCDLYSKIHQASHMVNGDIKNDSVKNQIIDGLENKIDIAIISPPCQGISIAGKSRNNLLRLEDPRNFLVFHAIEIVKKLNPDYILFENVSQFGSMLLPYNSELRTVLSIIEEEFDGYNVESKILDCADYGIPQVRKRNIIKVYKRNLKWDWPLSEPVITVENAIGHLPSIESGEESEFVWHFGRRHLGRHILAMRNTPTGKSAFDNEYHFPKDDNGKKVKGYNTTYKRIEWNRPAPTVTMRNDAISSQANVHPGRKMENGGFSDARVLSLRELFILMSLPEEPNIPLETSETLIRQVLGEAIPPLLLKKIFESI